MMKRRSLTVRSGFLPSGAGVLWRLALLIAFIGLLSGTGWSQEAIEAGGEAGADVLAPESPRQEVIDDLLAPDDGTDVYDDAGRRDPFINPLVKAAGEDEDGRQRPKGWEGMVVGELKLWGLTVFGEDPIAIFQGSDGLGYFVREGSELWDGKIIAIDFDNQQVVFQQKVEDPTSPERFREVVQKLNP